MSRPRATSGPPASMATARSLVVGDRVRFHGEKQARWKVRARGERYVILTQPYNLQRTVLYTVIDMESGTRGPDDFGSLGYETPEEIVDALARFEAREAALSARHSVPLVILAVKPKTAAASASPDTDEGEL